MKNIGGKIKSFPNMIFEVASSPKTSKFEEGLWGLYIIFTNTINHPNAPNITQYGTIVIYKA